MSWHPRRQSQLGGLALVYVMALEASEMSVSDSFVQVDDLPAFITHCEHQRTSI